MAQLKEILEIEKNRKGIEDSLKIYLFQEGTFYRAYEWSAWLCCRYVNQFKVTRKEQKSDLTDDGTVVFVGFPLTSLEKYLPESCSLSVNEDKSVVLAFKENMFGEDSDFEKLAEDFAHWKQSVPMASNKRTSLREELKNGMTEVPVHRMSDVLLKIIAFPIEQKSPMECMSFLAEMKRQITALL
jgi:hypothetical protein